MMLALVCVLFLLSWLIGRRRWLRSARALAAATLALLLLVGCGPLASWMLHGLQQTGVNDFNDWRARNMIVLLGAGTVRPDGPDATAEANMFAYGRIVESARLYRQCRAHGGDCKIEISGGDARGLGLSEAVVYRKVLIGLGIDQADLIMEPSSMNTWQNAQFSQPLLRQYRPERVVLVSSATHLRRAEALLPPLRHRRHAGALGLVDRVLGVVAAELQLHRGRCRLAQYLGIARYRVYEWLGWNVEAVRAGAL